MTIQVLQEGVGACSFVPWTSVAVRKDSINPRPDSSCFSISSSRALKCHTRMHGSIGSFRRSQTYVQSPENCKSSHRQPIRDASRLHDVGGRVRG
ncbi:hypothetical protein ARMGADRAFT_1015757 [Armillaria gallica]|uniref:Uncharacterized protein n=1 Tax=Armillaria gallica TaxID=47427 RepID=A0A2H3D1A3_ARMGA|nr:hypothetical protein ARMGADRAFT_1015757 [Armillaria gallica]